ncbi:hypothetical protein diail_4819 [Diaporthe ilicicola]|nr:hypothetical protein diail_4819 [Diaporthe ilicicola]
MKSLAYLITCVHLPLPMLMKFTQYEFLMHSILGLAASELIASDASLAEAAIAHRLRSIQAIKRKLASSNQGIAYAEGNALIATCFALTFQSVILEDGMAEYMAFIRGIIVIVIQMRKAGVDFMFKHLLQQEQGDLLRPHIDKVTLPDGMWEWKAGALASLEAIRSLCVGDDLKMKYLQMTEDMANGLDEKSPYKGLWPCWSSLSLSCVLTLFTYKHTKLWEIITRGGYCSRTRSSPG